MQMPGRTRATKSLVQGADFVQLFRSQAFGALISRHTIPQRKPKRASAQPRHVIRAECVNQPRVLISTSRRRFRCRSSAARKHHCTVRPTGRRSCHKQAGNNTKTGSRNNSRTNRSRNTRLDNSPDHTSSHTVPLHSRPEELQRALRKVVTTAMPGCDVWI
jgi:hypothetical protein